MLRRYGSSPNKTFTSDGYIIGIKFDAHHNLIKVCY